MRVFVLCTGRCGSMTFARACRRATNYTCSHESGREDFYAWNYPDNHIEVDNRLSWCVGRLHERFPDAYYVHLLRNREDVVRSFAERGIRQWCQILHGWVFAIKQGYPVKRGRPVAPGALEALKQQVDLEREAAEMVDTINANIRHFLRDKRHATVWIERPERGFPAFWRDIGAHGDLDAALAVLKRRFNAGIHDAKAV